MQSLKFRETQDIGVKLEQQKVEPDYGSNGKLVLTYLGPSHPAKGIFIAMQLKGACKTAQNYDYKDE